MFLLLRSSCVPTPPYRRAIVLAVALALMPASALVARAADPPSYRLDLQKPDAVTNGRIVFAEGTVDGVGHRFLLPEINILQPIALSIATAGDDDRVEVVLGRDRWDERIRSATTEHGAASFALRTQGDIRITLTAKDEPVHYLLAAWVGDDVTPDAPPVLVLAGSEPSAWMQWVLMAGAAVIAIGGLVLWTKNRTRGAGVVTLLAAVVLSGAALGAQTGTMVLGGPPPSVLPPSTLPPGALPPRGPVGRTWDQIHNPESPWNRRLQDIDNELSRFDNASRPFDLLNLAASGARAAADYYRRSEAFSPEDAGYTPDLSPDGMPSLPVGCSLTDDGAACEQCYQQAQSRLQGMMLLLERLRAIGESTARYNSAALSFGDTVSGIHGASGLAWQAQRPGIVRQFAQFEQTYESKRQAMMGSLRGALDDIAACEAEHFSNPDWFNRYGFMYYQFMDARYKR